MFLRYEPAYDGETRPALPYDHGIAGRRPDDDRDFLLVDSHFDEQVKKRDEHGIAREIACIVVDDDDDGLLILDELGQGLDIPDRLFYRVLEQRDGIIRIRDLFRMDFLDLDVVGEIDRDSLGFTIWESYFYQRSEPRGRVLGQSELEQEFVVACYNATFNKKSLFKGGKVSWIRFIESSGS